MTKAVCGFCGRASDETDLAYFCSHLETTGGNSTHFLQSCLCPPCYRIKEIMTGLAQEIETLDNRVWVLERQIKEGPR
jgi:hypothetical protein